jgi:hypothetical protein
MERLLMTSIEMSGQPGSGSSSLMRPTWPTRPGGLLHSSCACALAVILGACIAEPKPPEPPKPQEPEQPQQPDQMQDPAHSSQLDGPIDYSAGSGFLGSSMSLHIELDGSVVRTVTNLPDPAIVTTGTVAGSLIDALRGDVAAVDVASFRDHYSCDELPCDLEDAGGAALTIAADGSTTHISVDGAIDRADLPAGLTRILDDIDEISSQLR